MAGTGFLTHNAMKEACGETKEIIVDLGYVANAEERFRKLREYGIGKRNFHIECFGRLVMRCPKKKLEGLLATFPIVDGGTYWQTTHSWKEI